MDKSVFISHAWANDEIEVAVDRFVADLERKLAHPPVAWPHPPPSVWFDRNDVHGRSRNFNSQTLPAAKNARVGVFLLSNKWHRSPSCQNEANCFREHGKLQHERLVIIQLADDRAHNPPDYRQAPIFPDLWNNTYPTLLALDSRGDAHDWDLFLGRIAEEVLAAIQQSLGVTKT